MDMKNRGLGIWGLGVVIGMLALLFAPLTGISLICCIPAVIFLVLGGWLFLLEQAQGRNHAQGK